MQAKQERFKLDWHQQVLSDLLKEPTQETRVGSAFISIGHLLKFNLSNSFPVTTAKKLFFGQVKRELYCFLKGQTSAADLHAAGVTIWDDDMKRKGVDNIGPIYGAQWRFWEVYDNTGWRFDFDQLRFAIDELMKTQGMSRRALVSAWNAPQVLSDAAVLPPCHVLFQFNIVGTTLYTDVYQRSADAFLGLPFDVATFGIISKLVFNELLCNGFKLEKEQLNYHIANLHLYKAHEDAAIEELNNIPSNEKPVLFVTNMTIDTFDYNICKLIGYEENRIIKAKLLTNDVH